MEAAMHLSLYTWHHPHHTYHLLSVGKITTTQVSAIGASTRVLPYPARI